MNVDRTAAGHRSFLDFNRLTTQRAAGGTVGIVGRAMVFHIQGGSSSYGNTAIEIDGESPMDLADFGEVRSYFSGMNESFGWMTYRTGPGSAGYEFAEALSTPIEFPLMAVEKSALSQNAASGCRIVRVSDMSGLDIFSDLANAIFLEPEGGLDARAIFARPNEWLSPDTSMLVGQWEGRAVTIGLAMTCNGFGHVGWIGTTPGMRCKGFGRDISIECAKACFESGAERVFLTSGLRAMSMYASIGFETIRWYEEYKVRAPR